MAVNGRGQHGDDGSQPQGQRSGHGSVSPGGEESGSRFVGQVAIVTGGGSGLGEATAVRLGGEGAHVAVLDIRTEAAEATVRRIAEAGGRAHAYEVDVSDQASVRNVVADVAGGSSVVPRSWSTAPAWASST